MTRNTLVLWSAGVLWLLAACGGGGTPAPKPLNYHFDDMYIARVPMEEKQAIIEAQNEFSKAKMEHAEAQAGYDDVATKMEVAKNERQQALLEEKSAKAKAKAADDSGDMTRVNAAKGELRTAELGRRAADQKIEALKAKRDWLKLRLRATLENMYAMEARFELSKARVAKDNKIQPRDFKLAQYEGQANERSRAAQKANALAEREKAQFEREKKRWEDMTKEADRAAGKKPVEETTPGDE